MLFNSEKIQESFAYNKRGKLLKDREEVIWSIFQYLDYILQFKEAIVLTILEEKQYKTPLGKHRDINPHSAETERKTDFTEFRKNKRGYKGISKYYVIDIEKIALEKDHYTHSGKYRYVFWEKTGLHHIMFLEQQTDDALVGIADSTCSAISLRIDSPGLNARNRPTPPAALSGRDAATKSLGRRTRLPR